MTELLSNELIKKYFACDKRIGTKGDHICHEIMAYKILCAMQEPIRNGEKYLSLGTHAVGDVITENEYPEFWPPFHPLALRLPDRFQPEKKDYTMKVKISDSFCTWEYKFQHEGKTTIREVAQVIANHLKTDIPVGENIFYQSLPPEGVCEICHRCGKPKDELGVTEYKWDKNGGVHSCIHSFISGHGDN